MNKYKSMTNTEIDELSAEVFDIKIVDPQFCHGHSLRVKSGRHTVERWEPTRSKDHAFRCVDELDWQIGIYKTTTGLWGVHLESPCDEFDVIVKNESLSLAIVTACLEASEKSNKVKNDGR